MMLEISTSGNTCVNHVAETCAEDLPDREASSLRMDALNRLVQEPQAARSTQCHGRIQQANTAIATSPGTPAARYSRDRSAQRDEGIGRWSDAEVVDSGRDDHGLRETGATGRVRSEQAAGRPCITFRTDRNAGLRWRSRVLRECCSNPPV